MNRNFIVNSCRMSCEGIVMNESTVTFGQVLMVLQILLMARIMRFEARMAWMFRRMGAFLTGRMNGTGFRKNLMRMLKPVKGEKI